MCHITSYRGDPLRTLARLPVPHSLLHFPHQGNLLPVKPYGPGLPRPRLSPATIVTNTHPSSPDPPDTTTAVPLLLRMLRSEKPTRSHYYNLNRDVSSLSTRGMYFTYPFFQHCNLYRDGPPLATDHASHRSTGGAESLSARQSSFCPLRAECTKPGDSTRAWETLRGIIQNFTHRASSA